VVSVIQSVTEGSERGDSFSRKGTVVIMIRFIPLGKAMILVVGFLMFANGFGFMRETIDPVFPDMVLVQAGRFEMGDEVGDLWNGCRPVHSVTLTYDYWIGRYEITFEEYDLFCLALEKVKPKDHGWGRGDQPVILVSWWDAIEYCNWLSQQEGIPPAYDSKGMLLDSFGAMATDITQVVGYRLPTESEWEYAASGGHNALPIPPRFLFSGTDDLDTVGWYSGNSGEYRYTSTGMGSDYSSHGSSGIEGMSPQPVGSLQPNELGVYDMSGNLWEWCHDWYGPYTEESKTNPIGAISGHTRVIRGGSWIFGSQDCRVAGRFYRVPSDKIFRLGFRVARTVF